MFEQQSDGCDSSVAGRKQRWRRFLEPGAEPGFMFFVRYRDPNIVLPPWVKRWPSKKQERIEAAWAHYEYALAQTHWLHDDFVPYLDNLTGTEIFAEAFGCEVSRSDHTMPFARPRVFSAADADKLEMPAIEDSSLAYLFDIADELQRRGGLEATQRLVDMQSPMGIVAELWDKSDLFCSMVEEPEVVKALAAKVKNLVMNFHDEWLRRYGPEFVAHCPDYFMHGGITLSEDEVGSVSADMFEEFFLNDLIELSQRYGGIGIHCCAHARHQWGYFRNIPGLRLINLSHEANKKRDPEYIYDAYRYFEPIVQMHEAFSLEDRPETLPYKTEGARVVYQIQVHTKDQALRICDHMHEVREAVPAI